VLKVFWVWKTILMKIDHDNEFQCLENRPVRVYIFIYAYTYIYGSRYTAYTYVKYVYWVHKRIVYASHVLSISFYSRYLIGKGEDYEDIFYDRKKNYVLTFWMLDM